MMIEAIDLPKLTDNKLCTCKACITKVTCGEPTPDCYLKNCEKCPGMAELSNYLKGLL